jgi:type IV pilus assembly protein PilC
VNRLARKQITVSKFPYQVEGPAQRFSPPAHRASETAVPRAARPQPAPIYPGEAPKPAGARTGGRIRRDDVIYFASQLAVMVDTGVPLSEALDAIARQSENTGLGAMAWEIRREIEGGTEFSAALASRTRIFGSLFVALVKASEASGKMGIMLQRVSDYLQDERDTRKKVKGALIYPACMLGFCVLVVTGMMVFILPRFEKIYAGKGVVLPLPTRMLIGISGALVSYWYLFLLGIAGLATGAWLFFRTPAGQALLDNLRLRMPVLGGMYRKACLARCLRAMATMTSAGVAVLDMLAITVLVAGNSLYAELWNRLAKGVEQGSSLTDLLAQEPLVPRTVTQMVSAGEKTGRLAMVMDRVAGFCESDLRVAIKTVTNMIEPGMIVVMGIVIGAIALALLLPVFSLSRVVAH